MNKKILLKILINKNLTIINVKQDRRKMYAGII